MGLSHGQHRELCSTVSTLMIPCLQKTMCWMSTKDRATYKGSTRIYNQGFYHFSEFRAKAALRQNYTRILSVKVTRDVSDLVECSLEELR